MSCIDAALQLLCFFADFQPLNRYMFHIKGLPHAPAPMRLPSIHFVVQPVQSAHVSIHVGKHHVHKYIISLFPRPLQIGENTAWEWDCVYNEVVSLRDREFMYHAYVALQEV